MSILLFITANAGKNKSAMWGKAHICFHTWQDRQQQLSLSWKQNGNACLAPSKGNKRSLINTPYLACLICTKNQQVYTFAKPQFVIRAIFRSFTILGRAHTCSPWFPCADKGSDICLLTYLSPRKWKKKHISQNIDSRAPPSVMQWALIHALSSSFPLLLTRTSPCVPFLSALTSYRFPFFPLCFSSLTRPCFFYCRWEAKLGYNHRCRLLAVLFKWIRASPYTQQ